MHSSSNTQKFHDGNHRTAILHLFETLWAFSYDTTLVDPLRIYLAISDTSGDAVVGREPGIERYLKRRLRGHRATSLEERTRTAEAVRSIPFLATLIFEVSHLFSLSLRVTLICLAFAQVYHWLDSAEDFEKDKVHRYREQRRRVRLLKQHQDLRMLIPYIQALGRLATYRLRPGNREPSEGCFRRWRR